MHITIIYCIYEYIISSYFYLLRVNPGFVCPLLWSGALCSLWSLGVCALATFVRTHPLVMIQSSYNIIIVIKSHTVQHSAEVIIIQQVMRHSYASTVAQEQAIQLTVNQFMNKGPPTLPRV